MPKKSPASPTQINKAIPTPLYYQLLQILKQQIESGQLTPGDLIPTELQLMQQYQLSRATVRQAILQLVNDGYLRREKSKGTFVTAPPNHFRFIEGLRGFSAEMTRRGISYRTRVLEKGVQPASEKVAGYLEIPTEEPVFSLRRLRFVDERPFLIDRHYIPYKFCRGIEEKIGDDISLYSTLQQEYHLKLHHGWRNFEPVRASSKKEQDLLEVYSATNLLYVESALSSKENVPLDYFEALIHGKFTVDVVNTEEHEA